jgi:pimeloyl-ACP methyl ester carboxylesterase
MRSRSRRLLVWALALLSVVGALALAFVEVSARLLVRARNLDGGGPARAAAEDDADAPRLGVAAALRVEVGPPSAELAAWVLDPPVGAPPRATVVVLHGVGDRKRSMLGWGRALAAGGLRAILVDHRGHGASTGTRLGYGALEAADCARLLDALEARRLRRGPVGVMGISYGGATAILWAARDPRVGAVVAVAPFAALDEIVPRYLARMAPAVAALVPRPLVATAIARGARLAGFDPREARPIDAVARRAVPLLLVHGRRDVHIPPSDSERLAAAAGPSRAQLLLVDADHDTIGGHPQLLPAARALFTRALSLRD